VHRASLFDYKKAEAKKPNTVAQAFEKLRHKSTPDLPTSPASMPALSPKKSPEQKKSGGRSPGKIRRPGRWPSLI